MLTRECAGGIVMTSLISQTTTGASSSCLGERFGYAFMFWFGSIVHILHRG